MSFPNNCAVDKEEWDKFVEDFTQNERECGNEIIEDFVNYMSEEPGKTEAVKVNKNYTTILAALLSTAVNTKKELKELYEKTHTENVILFEMLKNERKAYNLEREEIMQTMNTMQGYLDQLGVTIGESMADKLNVKMQRLENKSIGISRMMVEMKTMQLDCCRMLCTVLK